MDRYRRLMPLVGLSTIVLVAACGGSAASTPTPAVPVGGGEATKAPPASTQAPAGGGSQAPGGAGTTQPPAGAASRPPVAVGSTEACSVLSAADIQALTGATLVGPVPAGQAGIQNGCLYELTDASGSTTSINLGVLPSGGRAFYDSQVASGGLTTIDGLGDAAVSPRPGNVLAVAGDVAVSVQYFGPTGPDLAITTAIARQVLANLGL